MGKQVYNAQMFEIDINKPQSLYDKFCADEQALTDNELHILKSYGWILEIGQSIIAARAAVEAWNHYKVTHTAVYDVLAQN